MAFVWSVLSVAKRGLWPQSGPLFYQFHRLFCNASDTLLKKLLLVSTSQIKPTLDDTPGLKSFEFSSWDALITGLRYCSSQKAQLVLEWRLERLIKDEVNSDQYCNIISLCGKIRNLSLAMHAFRCMEVQGIKPTTSIFNALLDACFCSGDVVKALSVFEIMENSERYKPNFETYDIFISRFSNLRNANKMKAWFAAKRAAGFSANLQNYEALISCCVKMRKFDRADRYYKEMMSSGLMPTVTISEHMIEGLCKQKNCEQVKGFMKFLLECGFEINGNIVEKIVELYSEFQKVDEMEQLIEILKEFNQVGEVLLRAHCGLIRLYAILNRLDDVEYSVGRMMSQGMLFRSPNDVEKVIASYFRQEAYDRLDVFLEHIKQYYKLNKSTYDLLVAGYRRTGLTEKLDMVMKEMKSLDW